MSLTEYQPSHDATIRTLLESPPSTRYHNNGARFGVFDGLYQTVARSDTFAFTVTRSVADLPPAVAVIVAVPGFKPRIHSFTLRTTEPSDDLHDTARSVAFAGYTLDTSCTDWSTSTVKAPSLTPEPEIDTDSTGTTFAFTVTRSVADLPPAVAVIVAVPALTAVTLPEASTVATDVSDDVQLTARSVAFDGATDADNCFDAPTSSETSPPAIKTDDTGTTATHGATEPTVPFSTTAFAPLAL